MKQSIQGFTLLELLVVIAIIGILAAILIPNMMNLRRSAEERTAQTFASNVTHVAFAWLADSQQRQISSLPTTCTTPTQLLNENGTPSGYSWGEPPSAVATCSISASSQEILNVTVTTTRATYINGAPQ